MLHCVALITTNVSEERTASINRMTRISDLGTLAVTGNRRKFFAACFGFLVAANVRRSSILVTLMMEGIRSSETSVLTRATWRNIPGYGTLLGVKVGRNVKADSLITICELVVENTRCPRRNVPGFGRCPKLKG
jgi:hypothetical protein